MHQVKKFDSERAINKFLLEESKNITVIDITPYFIVEPSLTRDCFVMWFTTINERPSGEGGYDFTKFKDERTFRENYDNTNVEPEIKKLKKCCKEALEFIKKTLPGQDVNVTCPKCQRKHQLEGDN